MEYKELGKLIKAERERHGWEQAELATRLEVGQQAVSGWERGKSRPRVDVLHKLVELFAGDINEWLPKAGYKIEKPVRPLASSLPLDHLTEETFELFSRDLVQALNPGADVHRYGARGHKQHGIDLYAKLPGGKKDYQCKRHEQFGPADVDNAVKATTLEALHHHLLLSRVASPGARDAIDKYDDWSLWDVEDISAKVRGLPKDEALRLIDTYFPGWRKDFLGVDEPSPWLTPLQFYQPLVSRLKIFSHGWGFVGRQKELEALVTFTKKTGTSANIVSGRGGIGKSRLLRAWADSVAGAAKVVFVSPGSEIEAKDLELLPQGESFLVVDDAHDRSDLVAILTGVARMRPNMKIVISTRPYGLTRVQDELTRSGVGYERDDTITLSDLSVEDATNLAKEIMGEVSGDVQHAKRIAEITSDCPLATVIGSRLVAEGRIKPDLLNNSEQFREELLRSFRNIVAGEIGGKDAEEVRDLLDLIAMVQPVDTSDPNFKAAAEELLERRFDKITRDMRALEDAGVLLRRGRLTRIAPDLLADYIRADASYDDKSKRPTGYADSVFNAVKDELAINLLVNISQLDWRLSTEGTQTALLDEVWASLEGQFKAAKIFGRHTILKALAKVAYYQPQRALDFAKMALDNPIDEIEEDAKPYSLGMHTSYRYVVSEVPPLLRYVAYHDAYLEKALDMLKKLADVDPRQPNQYPDHPVRILRDLAGVEPGKSLVFNERIVKHVLPWLDEPSNERFSPFDMLDELLATEGHQSEAKGITLTLKPYMVRAEAVAGLRKQIIDAAFKQLPDKDARKAQRALKTLEKALEYPHGLAGMEITEDDRKAWEPGIVEVLKRLQKLVAQDKIDPFLVVQIRGAVSWHARHSKTATKAAADGVLAAIPATRGHDIARALIDGWGWTFENEGGSMRNEEECARWRNQLATELIAEYDGRFAALIDMLEERVKRLNAVQLPRGDIGPFIAALTKASNEFTKALGEHLLEQPSSPLSVTFAVVVTVLAKNQYEYAISLASRAIETRDVVLTRCAARALGWSMFDIPVTGVEVETIKKLAKSDDVWVRHIITRVVNRFEPTDKATALDLLMSIKFTDAKEVADEVLGEIGEHGAFKVADLSADHLKRLLGQLVECTSIEGYNINTFLSELSLLNPDLALKLLMDRVEYNEAHPDDHEYTPLPYVHLNGPPLRFHETAAYEKLLRQVRDWASVKTNNWMRSHYGADLFRIVSSGFDETTLKVLQEWIMSGDRQKLEAAASLLSEAPRTFVFTHSQYVMTLLEQAEKQGEKCCKRVCSWLIAAAISGGRSGTPGQPFPEDIEQRDRSHELMSHLPGGSPAYKFYKTLYDGARTNIERDTLEDLDFD
jgi:transcriptional regulator with XRE-family HTH domain/tetratricopeptide (TPR) repeat protein